MRTKMTVCTIALTALAGLAFAGPLSPTVGPVGSTMKPISEVETRTAVNATNTPGTVGAVFVISQPGSYYLSGNVAVGASKVGVQINASDVTLDLNGFAINGQPGSSHGVWVGGGVGRVTVKNGTISTMGADGVNMTSIGPAGGVYRVEGLTVIACGQDGIEMRNGMVKDCIVHDNLAFGVLISQNFPSVVESVVSNNNGEAGLSMLNGTVRGCAAKDNAGDGYILGDVVVTDSVAKGNTRGFVMDRGLIFGCAAIDNVEMGIRVKGGASVVGNTVSSAGVGGSSIGVRVETTDGARIEGNTIVRQATGVSCGTANNLIIKNSFRGCTNAVSLVANNRLGPLATGTAQPAITGNSGGGLGVTDPNANIIH